MAEFLTTFAIQNLTLTVMLGSLITGAAILGIFYAMIWVMKHCIK